MKKRAVIITADDFGQLPEVNDAVLAGYDAGLITNAGIRVNATASSSAMQSAAMRPGLGVGLHLVLCEGRSTLPHRHIPNLVDGSGRFAARPLEAAWHYRRRAGLYEEIKAEIRAQLEKFFSAHLQLSYISGHFQLHLHPTVRRILCELAEEYPIPALRKPCGALVSYEGRQSLSANQRRIEVAMLKTMVRVGRLRTRGFLGPDRVGVLSPLRPTVESEVVQRFAALPRGVTELVCHPGSLKPRYDGIAEQAVVTSAAVRRAIEELDIELISYRDLVEYTFGEG